MNAARAELRALHDAIVFFDAETLVTRKEPQMNDFHKKRYERLEKNYAEMFKDVLRLGKDDADVTTRMVHDLIQATLEISRSIPNKTLKGNFFSPLPDYGDLMKLEDFQAHCRDGFIDHDGYGHPAGCESGFYDVRAQLRMDPNVTIIPSECDDIPLGTSHVVWFNR